MVVNQLIGNAGFLQFNEWVINGKQAIITLATSGGSGGGGYGNPNQSQIIQSGALAGTPFGANY